MADRRISTGTLTAIAEAIRAKTGGSDAYTPAQMAAAVTSLNVTDRVRVWAYTVTADVTDTETIVTDAWVKEHCTDPNFGVAFMLCGTPPTPSANYYAVNGIVTNYTTTGNATYGMCTRVNNGGTGTNQRAMGNAYSSNNAPFVYARAFDGALRFIASSSNVFPAGTYLIAAWY